jgi:hypothetical protein
MGRTSLPFKVFFAIAPWICGRAVAQEGEISQMPSDGPSGEMTSLDAPVPPEIASDEPQVPSDDAFLEEIPISVAREDGDIVFTLTEAWMEAELAVGGCTSVSMSYGASKAGRILRFKTNAKKLCSVEMSWARPDRSGVMVSFEMAGENAQ